MNTKMTVIWVATPCNPVTSPCRRNLLRPSSPLSLTQSVHYACRSQVEPHSGSCEPSGHFLTNPSGRRNPMTPLIMVHVFLQPPETSPWQILMFALLYPELSLSSPQSDRPSSTSTSNKPDALNCSSLVLLTSADIAFKSKGRSHVHLHRT